MEQRQDVTLTETWDFNSTTVDTTLNNNASKSEEIWQSSTTIAETFGQNTHYYNSNVSCRNSTRPEDNKTTRK